MSSFKFPPPPPPPPKFTSNDAQQGYSGQRGGYDTGRGDRGNERGGRGRGRGRGGNAVNGSFGGQRGGHGRGGGRGYVQQSSGQSQRHVDPNAQMTSLMGSQIGRQTMEAGHSHNAWATPPAPHAGQKRKWEDRSQHIRPTAFTSPPAKPQQGSKPPRAKAAVAPAVPSFGFSLPTLPGPSTAAKASNSSGKDVHKKGKIRLGLTNQPPPEEASSEEESGDEEATLGAKINGGGYAFEHEGQQIALQTEADIAAWIKDRRRNFPTRQKASEKAEAAAMRRKHELDFIRKLKGKPPRSEHIEVRQERQQHPAKPKQDTKKQEELAALRKKLHESMLEKRDAPRAVDLGLGYASETESDRESSILSESSVVSSSEESDEDEEEDENDSDAAPEPISAKIAPPPVKVPPPVSTATQNQPASETAGVCFKFQRDGRCPRGRNCRFKHTPREDMHEKRTTLFEKMVEQELLKSDQLALDAIKYLGQNGYLG